MPEQHPIRFRPPGGQPPPCSSNGRHHTAPAVLLPMPPAPAPLDEPYVFVPPPPAPTGGPEVDYEVVRTLQSLVSERVSDKLRGREVDNAEQRRITVEEAAKVVGEHADNRSLVGDELPPGYDQALTDAVIAHLLGLGRLQPLLDDDLVENIFVLGADQVRVEYADGRLDETSFTAAASDADLVEMLQRLAARGGQTERTLSTAKPVLHLRLPGGARMTVLYIITPRPALAIRRHRIREVSLDDMVIRQAMTPVLARFLAAAVRGNLNVMITGLPGSGKSTLLRAIASVIPEDEWFATLETVYELGLHETGRHRWVVPIEEREGHGEIGVDGRPQGELRLVEIFPHMLRMSMTRLIVGEVREAEVVAMFDAMNTTHGSLSTLHTRHPHATFERLAELLMRYGASSNRDGAYLTVANALDLVVYVHMERRRGQAPRRYVSHVIEVDGPAETGGIARSDLFMPRVRGGLAEPTGVRPNDRVAEALAYGGFDLQELVDGGTGGAG